MAEANIIGKTLCPWCRNELEVVKSPKSGYHYANCKSCNPHFRNIPITLVDMKGKEKPQSKPDVKESALEQLRKDIEPMAQKLGESALERLRREVEPMEHQPEGSALDRICRKATGGKEGALDRICGRAS